jgi:uncharacterized protein (TIGR02118 family)
MIKVMAVLKRKDGMSREDFFKHWQEVHIPMVKTLPGIRKFVLNLVVEDLDASMYPQIDQFDGCSELYFDDVASAKRAFESAQGKINGEDALNFIGKRLFLAVRVADETVIEGR